METHGTNPLLHHPVITPTGRPHISAKRSRVTNGGTAPDDKGMTVGLASLIIGFNLH